MFWDDPRHPLDFFQLCDVILRSSAACLQIFTHKSKGVNLKQGCRNYEIVELLHIPESTIIKFGRNIMLTVMLKTFQELEGQRKWSNVVRLGCRGWWKRIDFHGKVLREITNDFNEGVLFVFTQRLCSGICTKTKYLEVSFVKKWLFREVNKKKRISWCLEWWRWTVQLH